jgi:transposase
MTYSTDFRRKALDIKEQENLTTDEAAKRFGIGTANFSRWSKNLEPKRTRNKPSTKIDMEALKHDVELHPDAYNHERAIRFGVTEGGIRKALKRLGISYKKTLKHPKANNDARQVFQEKMKFYEQAEKNIVFIDESGFSHDMPRRKGYASIGKRCFGTRKGVPMSSVHYWVFAC